jgi:hypothetical protein
VEQTSPLNRARRSDDCAYTPGGFMRVPNGPGIDVDEAVLKKYCAS